MSDLTAVFTQMRAQFHAGVLNRLLRIDVTGIPSNADRHSKASTMLAKGIYDRIEGESAGDRLAGQTSGSRFELLVVGFLTDSFSRLGHLRPGHWDLLCVAGRNRAEIARYEQYGHLTALENAAARDPELAAALGNDYTITPDIVVVRGLESDESINRNEVLVDDNSAQFASLRERQGGLPLLHASISCKWTIRSDRAQNARSEALNLIRNRKGRVPHIAVVTGEPLPSRIASTALGTGDIDCVYHFALTELMEAASASVYEDASELLRIMVEGRRLKDIADLPLDLAV